MLYMNQARDCKWPDIHSNDHLTNEYLTKKLINAENEVKLSILLHKAAEVSKELNKATEVSQWAYKGTEAAQRKQRKREIQKKYVKHKKALGFNNLNCWINGNHETCRRMRLILSRLSESEITELVENYTHKVKK
uniref:Uncharacterized protein n=1 Tax=Gracilaria robusta TaxID=38400 RepID=O46328_9FLOR|nr:ORF6 [Gracilaria robusta]